MIRIFVSYELRSTGSPQTKSIYRNNLLYRLVGGWIAENGFSEAIISLILWK